MRLLFDPVWQWLKPESTFEVFSGLLEPLQGRGQTVWVGGLLVLAVLWAFSGRAVRLRQAPWCLLFFGMLLLVQYLPSLGVLALVTVALILLMAYGWLLSGPFQGIRHLPRMLFRLSAIGFMLLLPVVPALLLLLVAGITFWSYQGVPGAGEGRVYTLAGLRNTAWVVAMLPLLRPALTSPPQEDRQPSVLLIALDGSQSMTVQDEFGLQSRWQAQRQTLKQCEAILKQLQDEQSVSPILLRFAEDVGDYDPDGKPDGKRTDFGQLLHSLYQRHQGENLRALLILSDGADNGARYDPLRLARDWRGLSCPLHTFALGKITTTSNEHDVAFTHIMPEPSPVPVKGKLSVKGTLDAPGFEKAKVRVRLFINDDQVAVEDRELPRTRGNEVTLTTDAPDTPGEIKVTLKVDPLRGEVSRANNEISTYVTVIKEGISILFVDKLRFPEPQRICDALSSDPSGRLRLYMAWRRTDEPSPEQADLFEFRKKHYDVIILGDVSARRLAAGNPKALTEIGEMVRKGAGLMMMGGYETFGNGDWPDQEIEQIDKDPAKTRKIKFADLLPVDLVPGQIDQPVQMVPTEEGWRQEGNYILRLAEKDDAAATASKQLWKRLPKLQGMTRLGDPKRGAVVLARSDKGVPLLAAQKYGEGRVLAFGGDTTWEWQRLGQPDSSEGLAAHAQFWRRVAIWLAHQEEADANLQLEMPGNRRLRVGEKLEFSVSLRGKGGHEIPDARFSAVVVGPRKTEKAVPVSREGGVERWAFWKTDEPGEYRLEVRGTGQEIIDGKPTDVGGEKAARFLVYHDDAETRNQAADHAFLRNLAKEGGGKAYRAEELSTVLKELQAQPLPQNKAKSERWPDWRRAAPKDSPMAEKVVALSASGTLYGFLLFVGVVCLEWFLRRFWGLV